MAAHERVLCLDCEGTGLHMRHVRTHGVLQRVIIDPRKHTCPACKGTGYRIQYTLPFGESYGRHA